MRMQVRVFFASSSRFAAVRSSRDSFQRSMRPRAAGSSIMSSIYAKPSRVAPETNTGISPYTASVDHAVPIDQWALDPAIVHLNHGSYGGSPKRVIAAADAWRTRLEAAPMKFLVLDWQRELDRARERVAAFVHAPVDRLAFVPNATTGVAIALAHAKLGPGDEVITTD